MLATGYSLSTPDVPAFTVGNVVLTPHDLDHLESRPALLEHEEEALQLFANVIDECYERGLYQLMTSYQAFLLGFHVDRKKWTKAVELCAFAAGQEELPEGARQLWRKLEAATRTRTLAAGEIQEARRQLRADWAQMAVA